MKKNKDFRILSLDGGGSKGVYSLGFLREVEKLKNIELYKCFDLIYGTSTGAIIAALIALGKSIDEIITIYFSFIPDIMGTRWKCSRSRKLEKHARNIFGDAKFDAFKVDIGIVAMHYDYAKPMIFKSSVQQAHGRHSTFDPGFGRPIADAILASCAAFPLFEPVTIKTDNQGETELVDGGFVGNNPTLFALADAVKALNIPIEKIKMLSVGVGEYPQAAIGFRHRILLHSRLYNFFTGKVLSANTNTIEELRKVLFPDVQIIRVNDSFTDNQYSTNLLESDENKLNKLMALGRESFGEYEGDVKKLFDL